MQECRFKHACMLSCFRRVQLFAIPWVAACQAPLSTRFSWQEYWSGLPCPPPGDLSLRFTSQGTASPEGSVHRCQIRILQVNEVTHPFIPGHLIKCGSFMNIYALPLNSVSNFIGLLLFICSLSHSTYIYGVLTMCQALTIMSVNEQTSFSSFSVHVF